MAYEAELADLSPLKADRVSFSGSTHTKDRECVLSWKIVGDERRQTVLDYLRSVATVTNQAYDRKKAVLPGVWRNAGFGWNAQNQMYYLTLREGWATSLTSGEMMVKAGSDTRSDNRTYEFYWRNIAAEAVDSCVEGLRATGSMVNPTVQGEIKDGAFSISSIMPLQQDDGSYWISITCTRVATILTIADIAALVPVRKDTRDIENPFGLEGGYTTHVGRKPTDGIVLTYRALSMASRDVIMALTDDALQGLLGVAEKAKFEFIKRDLTEDSGNTLALSLAYQYIPLKLTTPEADARKVSFGLSNQSGKLTMKRSWPRIDPTQSKDLLTANENQKVTDGMVTDPMMDGVTYSGDWLARTTISEMTGNDGDRIEQELIKEGDQALNLKYGSDPLHVTYELWRVDASVSKINDFMAQTGSEAVGVGTPIDFKWDEPELGITKIVKTDWNADRSANLHAIYSTAKDLELVELFTAGTGAPGKLTVQDDYVSTTERGFGWNIPVASLKTYSDYYKPSVRVVNTKNEFEITRRDEHTFDFRGVLTTFVPIDSGDVVTEDTTEKTVIVRTGKYLTGGTYFTANTGEYVRPTAATANVRVDLDVKDNLWGSRDAIKTTTTFKELDDGGVVIEDNESRTVTKRTGSHILAAKLADGQAFGYPVTATDGTLVEITPKLNDVQTYDVVRLETITHNQTSVSTVNVGPNEATTLTAKTADTAEATPTAAAVNLKSVVKNKERPDGKFETEKIDTVVTPWQHPAASGTPANDYVVVSNIGGIFTEKIQKFKGRLSIPAADAGQLVKALENELKSFDGEIIERVKTDGAASGFVTLRSSLYEWKSTVGEARFPVWTTSTDSDVPQRITGYNLFQHEKPYKRKVTVEITRKYSILHPVATDIVDAAFISENASYVNGGGVARINQVSDLGGGLFAADEKVLTASDWVGQTLIWTALYSV
jgi:hypothetical protein